MPWEHSPDGLIKHLVHPKLNTRECCVEAYMQFLKPAERSGKHRHMWEEIIFVAEGSGYDLHWDLKFDCLDAFQWEWAEMPKRFEWKRGDFIYIPPFTMHQHVATRGRPADHDQQPHRQGDGLRLGRRGGAGARFRAGRREEVSRDGPSTCARAPASPLR